MVGRGLSRKLARSGLPALFGAASLQAASLEVERASPEVCAVDGERLEVRLEAAGFCRGSIGRHPVVRTRMAFASDGREAETRWAVEERFGDGAAALVACWPKTGRTHQIRVHLAGMGHPLLGDTTYGFKPARLPEVEVPRVMLHAAGLELPHPDTGATLRLETPPPEDFARVLERLRRCRT